MLSSTIYMQIYMIVIILKEIQCSCLTRQPFLIAHNKVRNDIFIQCEKWLNKIHKGERGVLLFCLVCCMKSYGKNAIFSCIVLLVNSQLVCLPPVGILNLVMFIWILIYHCLHWSWKAPKGSGQLSIHLHLITKLLMGFLLVKACVFYLILICNLPSFSTL